MKDFRLPGDDATFHFVNGLNSPVLDFAFTTASTHAFGLLMGAALALWLFTTYRGRSYRPIGQAIIAAAAVDFIGARLLKPWFERTRPSFALPPEALRVLSEAANSGSMPSLHAATSFAVATTLFLLSPAIGRVAMPVAAFIALSRVAVGVHWPSDVYAGAIYGLVAAVLIEIVARRFLGPFDARPEDPKHQAAFARGKKNIDAARAGAERSTRR